MAPTPTERYQIFYQTLVANGILHEYDKAKVTAGEMEGNCSSCYTVGMYMECCGRCGVIVTVFTTKVRTHLISPNIVARFGRRNTAEPLAVPSQWRTTPCYSYTHKPWDPECIDYWAGEALRFRQSYDGPTATKEIKALKFLLMDLYHEAWQNWIFGHTNRLAHIAHRPPAQVCTPTTPRPAARHELPPPAGRRVPDSSPTPVMGDEPNSDRSKQEKDG